MTLIVLLYWCCVQRTSVCALVDGQVKSLLARVARLRLHVRGHAQARARLRARFPSRESCAPLWNNFPRAGEQDWIEQRRQRYFHRAIASHLEGSRIAKSRAVQSPDFWMNTRSMKRLRIDQWTGQLQPPRNPRSLSQLQPSRAAASRTCPFSQTPIAPSQSLRAPSLIRRNPSAQWRPQSCQQRAYGTRVVETDIIPDEATQLYRPTAVEAPKRSRGSTGDVAGRAALQSLQTYNSFDTFPRHAVAIRSARLSALHARLQLPAKLPLQTLARCLVDPSVDSRPGYNNAPLAVLGSDFLGYSTSEYLICHYPRLPMPILFAAQHAFVGPQTLSNIRQEWGVDVVAAPGSEVDAGLLQLKRMPAGNALASDGISLIKDHDEEWQPTSGNTGGRNDKPYYRRGMSSRIVYDDQFGDLHNFEPEQSAPYPGAPSAESADASASEDVSISTVRETQPTTVVQASASFVRALFGALYLHAGSQAAKDFHAAHILSRKLALDKLFAFTNPTRDLSRLCAREGFESPVARLISETGRLSRHPVFVVGIYSGNDKLGEGAGSSLDEGRVRAAAAALRSWYLYSPPVEDVVLPSEVEGAGAQRKTWKAQMVDPGEIIT